MKYQYNKAVWAEQYSRIQQPLWKQYFIYQTIALKGKNSVSLESKLNTLIFPKVT